MSGFQTPITIKDAMEKIYHREYLIPAFQREYVWDAMRVENLFDSLMREYPINSMLFWEVKSEAYKSFVFYDFLSEFVESHKYHNQPTNVVKDFYAVLDGQQRLTSLYLGLYGTYAYHTKYYGWDYSTYNFPQRRLYLNLSQVNNNATEDDKMYQFLFLKDDDTQVKDLVPINDDKWFRVGKIIDLSSGIRPFVRENSLSDSEEDILDQLRRVICERANINYYLETAVQPNQAVNIFVRTNAGGKTLSISDILLSLTIAGWKVNAKEEFILLANTIYSYGFSINHDYILKAFLCLYHSSVKYQISSFDTNFLNTVEKNWKSIKDCIASLFELLQSFGLDNATIKSYNATLPILCYLYWNGKCQNFTTSIATASDRDVIRKWLLKSILYRSFGASSDSVLQRAIKDLKNQPTFPASDVSQNMGQPSVVDPVWVDSLLATQKDDPYAFSIVSLLYPDCNFATTKFDKDHLHPAASFETYKTHGGKYDWPHYNSIVNLQLLESSQNKSKGDMDLSNWVQATLAQRPNLKAETYLPTKNSLLLQDFDSFYDDRKNELATFLMKELTI